MKTNVIKALKKLVQSFDDEMGVSIEIFDATYALIDAFFGDDVAYNFVQTVKHADGRYFLRKSHSVDEVWDHIIGSNLD